MCGRRGERTETIHLLVLFRFCGLSCGAKSICLVCDTIMGNHFL